MMKLDTKNLKDNFTAKSWPLYPKGGRSKDNRNKGGWSKEGRSKESRVVKVRKVGARLLFLAAALFPARVLGN